MSITTSLLAGLILGSIGMGYCLYGKKQGHKLAFWCGIALIALPYFIDQPGWLVMIAIILMALPKYIKR